MTEEAKEEPEEKEEEETIIPWPEFLLNTPPGEWWSISEMVYSKTSTQGTPYMVLVEPDLLMNCSSKICGGERVFRANNPYDIVIGSPEKGQQFKFLHYLCRNCSKSTKSFSLMLVPSNKKSYARKLGEYPAFGHKLPSRVITMIGPDLDLFLKGRRAENQGLGIGAFAYYRRVVDNQKGRLLDQMIKASVRLGASKEQIETLQKAKEMKEFSKALDTMKPALPETLMLNGQNPLRLLYKSLSNHLHEEDDEECLRLAKDIRVVLTELADRISQALKDKTEIDEAVKRLLDPKKNTSD